MIAVVPLSRTIPATESRVQDEEKGMPDSTESPGDTTSGLTIVIGTLHTTHVVSLYPRQAILGKHL